MQENKIDWTRKRLDSFWHDQRGKIDISFDEFYKYPTISWSKLVSENYASLWKESSTKNENLSEEMFIKSLQKTVNNDLKKEDLIIDFLDPTPEEFKEWIENRDMKSRQKMLDYRSNRLDREYLNYHHSYQKFLESRLLEVQTIPIKEHFGLHSDEGDNENGKYLTYRQAAWKLSYSNYHLQDPRSDPKKHAYSKAMELCGKQAPTAGQQLFAKYHQVRNSGLRRAMWNTAAEDFKDGNQKPLNSLIAFVRELLPHLSADEKKNAEQEITEWETKKTEAS